MNKIYLLLIPSQKSANCGLPALQCGLVNRNKNDCGGSSLDQMNRIPFGRGCCNRSSLVPDPPPHKQTLETENENVTVWYDFAFQ